MGWKGWLQSLASASISGAATGTLAYMQQGQATASQIGIAAGVGGLVGLLNYLIKSPLQVTPPAAGKK